MSEFIKLAKGKFGSSCYTTPQWDSFYRKALNHFKRTLAPIADNLKMSKGHFYISGFFTRLSDSQVLYFMSDDFRYKSCHGSMILRTAKGYQDYTGGDNKTIDFDSNFEANLLKLASTLWS